MSWAPISGFPILFAGGSSGGTTSPMDTTGANFLAVSIGWYTGFGGVAVLADSYGNTWTPLTPQGDGASGIGQIWYCANPTVGTGHTFTVSGTSIFVGFWVGAFSGASSSPFDQQSGASSFGPSSAQPGSLTPTNPNSLFIGALEFQVAQFSSVDSGFTGVLATTYASSAQLGLAGGYLIQSGGPTVNPTFTQNGPSANGCVMAVFSPATGGTSFSMTMSGGVILSGSAATPSFAASDTSSGGVALGGSAPAAFATSKTGSGGVVLSGSDAASFAASDTSSGGLILGGSATVTSNSNFAVTMSGGAVLGGSAAESWSTSWSMSGGLVTGGSSPGTLTASRTSSGGLTLGGSAHAVFAASDTMAGGVILGGAAVVVPPSGASITMSGGATLGGAAGLLWSSTYGMSGGLETGGQATVVFVGPDRTVNRLLFTARLVRKIQLPGTVVRRRLF